LKLPDIDSKIEELVDYSIKESLAILASYGITDNLFAEAMAVAMATFVAVFANLLVFTVAVLALYQLATYELRTSMVCLMLAIMLGALWVNTVGFHFVLRVVRRIKHWK
jgi:hypothetical protein